MKKGLHTLGLVALLLAAACVEEPEEQTAPAEEETVQEEGELKYPEHWGDPNEPLLPVPAWWSQDSLRWQETDTLVVHMRTDETPSQKRGVIYPGTYTPMDSIAYTVEKGHLTSIIARYSPPAQELYLEYYFKDGDLRYVRHREWNMRPENCGAREMNMFLENGDMFFARERKTSLDIGEPPARIAFRRLQPSQRSKEEMIREMEAHWPRVREAVMSRLEGKGG